MAKQTKSVDRTIHRAATPQLWQAQGFDEEAIETQITKKENPLIERLTELQLEVHGCGGISEWCLFMKIHNRIGTRQERVLPQPVPLWNHFKRIKRTQVYFQGTNCMLLLRIIENTCHPSFKMLVLSHPSCVKCRSVVLSAARLC